MTTYIHQQLTLIDIKYTIWAGEKKLPKDELDVFKRNSKSGNEGRNLKDSKAFQTGAVLLIDPARLRNFHTSRSGLQRELREYGLPYMSSIGVPNKDIDAAMMVVDKYEKEFKKLLSEFIFNYDRWVKEWANNNQDMSDFILANKKSVKDVETVFRYACNPYKLAPINDSNEARQQLEETATELSMTLYDDIANVARKALRDVKKDNREHVSQKIRNTFAGMLKKLQGLAFLDGAIVPLCEAMQASIDTLPKEGKMTGNAFLTVMGILTTLSDPITMKMVGEGKEKIKGPAQPGLISMMKAAPSAIPQQFTKKTRQAPTEVPTMPAKQPFPRQSPMAQFKL